MAKVVKEGDKGTSETLRVKFAYMNGDIKPAKGGFPAAMVAVFRQVTSDDIDPKEYTFDVPVENPEAAIRTSRGFLTRALTTAEASSPAGMQAAILELAKQTPLWADTRNNYVRRFIAPPGTYVGALGDVHRKQGVTPAFYEYTGKNFKTGESEQVRRTSLYLEAYDEDGNPTGLMTEINIPWEMRGTMGDKPSEDGFTRTGELSAAWVLLEMFGLDWAETLAEIEACPCLFDREGRKGMMGNDPKNVMPYLYERTMRSPKMVQWVVVTDAKTGVPVILKEGDFKKPRITPVVVLGGKAKPAPESKQEVDEFEEQANRLTATLDKFVKLAGGESLQVGSSLTDEGREIAKAIIVPLVRDHYPSLALKEKDGKKAVGIPFTQEYWSVDALVAMDLTFEAAVAAMSGPVDDLDTISDLTNPTRFFEWLAAAPVKGALEAVGKVEEL